MCKACTFSGLRDELEQVKQDAEEYIQRSFDEGVECEAECVASMNPVLSEWREKYGDGE